jgi:hypothetical protein
MCRLGEEKDWNLQTEEIKDGDKLIGRSLKILAD